MTRDELDSLWRDRRHWTTGVYRCLADPRVVVPKRIRWMGWTINFAHPWAWPTLWLSLLIAVGPVLTMLALGLRDPRWLLAGGLGSTLVLTLLGAFLAARGR